ncbi:shikimate dehydrogenase family protein [Bradyrhizobium sp.]|uniref:shikimate dehydrogenase family protein n=1 Tax=Bradyrhizobium sp. TaxID=376 RepID=UPI003C728705
MIEPGTRQDIGNLAALSGETRVFAIVGDPIAQVKSPFAVTQALNALGRNCVVVPIHVTQSDFDDFVRGAGLAKNLDGLIATVPHKFAAYAQCTSATDRAHFLRAVNVMRRNPDGTWHGDMFDGQGFVDAMRASGAEPRGKRALLVGAGGAGSAIALALIEAGLSELVVHDVDQARRDELLARLEAKNAAVVDAGSTDPRGCALVVNATPLGMRLDDPFPLQIDHLTSGMFVGDVITEPGVTPLIQAARRLGCRTQIGTEMFDAQLRSIRDFLIGG